MKVIGACVCMTGIAGGAGVAFGAASDLDLTYDGDGVAKKNVLGTASADALSVQSDGKAVAAGTSDIGGTENAVVARFNIDGTPDNATFGGGDGDFQAEYNGDDTFLRGVAVRPTGQIVTAGFTDSTGTEFGIIGQHTSAGALDTAGFGGGDGLVSPAFNILSDPGSGNRLDDLALAANGDAIAVGTAESLSSVERFGIFSVTSTGVPRNPFGSGTIGESQVHVGAVIGSNAESSANAVAIDPLDGDLIVVGDVDPTSADGGSNDDQDAAVVRLTSAGVVDTGSGFGGGDGVVTADIGNGNGANEVVVQPDGKIVIAGDRDTDAAGLDIDHFVMRLNANGASDAGFGDGGDGTFEQTVVTSDNFGRALVRLPDGRLVVGGETLASQDWVVARYTAAGLPDGSWDADGSRAYAFNPDNAELSDVALQPDGKTLVAGQIAADLAVGRLEADPPPPPPVVNQPVVTPLPTQPAGAAPAKKCKKGQKLRKGKCVKKKRKKRKKRR